MRSYRTLLAITSVLLRPLFLDSLASAADGRWWPPSDSTGCCFIRAKDAAAPLFVFYSLRHYTNHHPSHTRDLISTFQ